MSGQPEELRQFELKLALDALKPLGSWISETIRQKKAGKEDPALRAISTRLDELLSEVGPCFAVGGLRSFIHVTSNLGLAQDEAWRHTNDGLAMASAWFQGFAKRGDPRQKVTPEVLEIRLDELNSLVFWTSRFGQQLRALVQAAREDSGGRISFSPLADHFDNFLTQYEALLTRLPADLHVRGARPAPGMTSFFLRLRG